MNGLLWITWERHRRTQTLAAEFGAELLEVGFESWGWKRFLITAPVTVYGLLRRRPRVLIVQNPSLVLAVLACVMKPLLRYRLVVDRHTTFLLGKGPELSAIDRLYGRLSDFTLRSSELTIVTNEFLRALVEERGGRAVVLPDKIPTLDGSFSGAKPRSPWGLLVGSFAPDEPYAAAVEAARSLGDGVRLLITGNAKHADPRVLADAPANVRFTGFVPDGEYAGLMRSADFVIVLTTAEHCLVCGGYEALAAGKPLIVSDTRALRDYYVDAAVYASPDVVSIREAIALVLEDLSSRKCAVERLRASRSVEWAQQAKRVTEMMAAGPSGSRS